MSQEQNTYLVFRFSCLSRTKLSRVQVSGVQMISPTLNTSIPSIVDQVPAYTDTLNRDGYVRIPGLLTPEEIKTFRAFFLEKFKNPEKYFENNDYFEAMFEIYERYEELNYLLFREPLVSIVRAALGESFALMRASAVHYNRYGWWWHKDTSNEERAGHRYHLDPDYRQLIAVYYFQDNHPQYGGGLDVEPGSHKFPDPGFQAPKMVPAKPSIWKKILRQPQEEKMVPDYNNHLVKNPVSIKSKAGDLIIFDVKINHRATQKTVDVVPPEFEKFALFTTFSRNNHTLQKSQMFVDASLTNPMSSREYPESIRDWAKKVGIHLA